MPTSERDPELQTLLDRQAIHDVLMRYSRGLDRHDRKVLESVLADLKTRGERYPDDPLYRVFDGKD